MPPKEKAKIVLEERSVLEKFDGDVVIQEDGSTVPTEGAILRERITAVYNHEKKHGSLKREFFDEKGKPQPELTEEESGPLDLSQGE